MGWVILGDDEKGTLLSTCYVVSLFKGARICSSNSVVSCQSFLLFVCSTFQLGNIWRDKPVVRSHSPHDRCEEDLDQAEIIQGEKLP